MEKKNKKFTTPEELRKMAKDNNWKVTYRCDCGHTRFKTKVKNQKYECRKCGLISVR